MTFRVFSGKMAFSWAKAGTQVGFLHFSRAIVVDWAIQFKRAYLRESIQPPEPWLNRIPHA